MRRPPTFLLVLAFFAAIFAAGPAVARSAEGCGPGLEAVHTDGLVMCTHGNDEPPPGVDTTRLPSTDELWMNRLGTDPAAGPGGSGEAVATVAAAGNSVACIGDGTAGPRVQLVYARATDVAGRYAAVVPLIQQHAADADNIVNTSAGRVGEGRRIRFVTDGACNPDVLNITMTATGDDTFTNTINELRAKGLTGDDRKYLVFVDAAVGICGLGQVYLDDRPGAENPNNAGRPMYSRVDTACWQHAATHELLHTMGAVQNSAPHSTGAGHCTDEVDVMCYRDTASTVTRQVCDRAGQVDCNNDDYFHPSPAPGSYLATKWNVADSRFLETTAAPPPPPPVTVTVPDSGLAGVAWPVQVETASATAQVVWTSTRTDCTFTKPRAARSSWSCPVTAQGGAEITVHVTDNGVVTPYSAEVVIAVPSSPRATVVALTAQRKKIPTGQSLTMTAVVQDGFEARPIHGVPVTFWSRERTGDKWLRVDTATTGHDGRALVTVKPSRNTVYAARTQGSATWAGSTSGERLIRVMTRVTGRLKAEAIIRGRTATVAGAVSPDKAGQRVHLERYASGRWVRVLSRQVSVDSRYAFTFAADGVGVIQLRVVKPPDLRNAKGATRPMVLSVR